MKNKILNYILGLLVITACSKSGGLTNIDPNVNNGNTTPADTSSTVYSTKKGACLTTKHSDWSARVQKLNVYWHYSWGIGKDITEPDSVRFVPMQWGKWGLASSMHVVDSLKQLGKVKYLLGFNEPDNKDQANMTVDEAVNDWPQLMALDIPLGSPACVHADGTWMQDFMQKVEAKNYRVDFICVHWYGGTNAQGFLTYLKKIHDMYHRPIWITEFAPADWNATSPSTSKVTKSGALLFMEKVLPALQDTDYVQRYSWFSASETSAALGNSALFDTNGNLTALGLYYSKF